MYQKKQSKWIEKNIYRDKVRGTIQQRPEMFSLSS